MANNNNNNNSLLDSLVPSIPKSGGPLDHYRLQASFDSRQLKLKFLTEDVIQLTNRIWKDMSSDPIFDKSEQKSLSLDEQRSVTMKRSQRLVDLDHLPLSDLLESPLSQLAFITAVGSYDWSLLAKTTLLYEFPISALRGSGTAQHDDIVRAFEDRAITGCFCLTEMSHGSNSRGLRTTATFSVEKQAFELHSEDFEAAKVWSGNLGKTATHAVVFAQLVTGKVSRGLHSFIVPIRDPRTMRTYPGVTVGDMGEKIGLNGMDNGFMMFDHYHVKKSCLLNKLGDVLPDGTYKTPFKDPNKRFGASLGTLSGGRTSIIHMANTNLQLAVVVAIRYSAARRQFGGGGDKESKEETPVLEYQMQQCRLIPYLASAFVHHVFAASFFKDFFDFTLAAMSGEKSDRLAAMGVEIHGISSAGKPLSSWTAQGGIQECREACGGHGYLKVARFGELRDDNDANCTYEGDNNVLLMQTSNWLIGLWGKDEEKIEGFTSSVEFIRKDGGKLMKSKFSTRDEEFLRDVGSILRMYQALIVRFLDHVTRHLNEKEREKNKAQTRNDSQMYLARTLAIVFVEQVALERYQRCLLSGMWNVAEKSVLSKMGALYGLWKLEKHVGHLYEFGILSDPADSRRIQSTIVDLCRELTPEAVGLADVLAPPDFVLNSALGCEDGLIYKNLQASFLESPDCFGRASFWPDLVRQFQSKL